MHHIIKVETGGPQMQVWEQKNYTLCKEQNIDEDEQTQEAAAKQQ